MWPVELHNVWFYEGLCMACAPKILGQVGDRSNRIDFISSISIPGQARSKIGLRVGLHAI